MAATFIAIVVPMVRKISVLVAVLLALVLSVVFSHYRVEGGLIIASLCAMSAGFAVSRWLQEPL